jgi:dTMP kinase
MVLIVIEGTDGSGKATQTALLVEKLKQAGKQVEMFDFPQYGQKSAALVEEYLNGKFGTADEVGPYRASIFFACDRYAASFRMRELLSKGTIVIANRYATTNMAHQAGKIRDPEERDAFLEWENNLEFGIFGIPKPDKVIVLHVPPEIGQTLVGLKKGAERKYLEDGKKQDIHEADINHLRNASEAYLYSAKKYGWEIIECAPGGKLKTIEDIAAELWGKVSALL